LEGIMKKRSLTDRELAIIRGSLLGDMSMRCQGITPNLGVRHSFKDLPYMQWLRQELPILFTIKPRTYTTIAWGKQHTLLAMDSRVHSDLLPIYELLYTEGKKIITKEYLCYLTPLSIAVWYMDDGCLYFNKNRHGKHYPYLMLSTHSFSKVENILIQDWFASTFDIHWNISREIRRERTLYRLQLGKGEEVRAFLKLIRPYVISHFHRKLEYTVCPSRPLCPNLRKDN